MKAYLARLSSLERRFVVGVMVVVFVLLNAVFVWPRFSEWGRMRARLQTARFTLERFQREIGEMPKYERLVKALENEGLAVPPEDQAVEFSLTIQSLAAQSGVNIISTGPLPLRTNQFFIERAQNLSVQSGEQQLVDFLYNLGAGASLTRVRALSLRPDPPRHQLSANLTLVASYQKKPSAAAAPARREATAAPSRESRPPAPARREAGPAKPATSTAKKP
jgi:hypothetical protein